MLKIKHMYEHTQCKFVCTPPAHFAVMIEMKGMIVSANIICTFIKECVHMLAFFSFYLKELIIVISLVCMHLSTPFYATSPTASSTAIRIQTAMCFHGFPVGERFQPATDKGKIKKRPEVPWKRCTCPSVWRRLAWKKGRGSETDYLAEIRGNSALTFTSISIFFLDIVM